MILCILSYYLAIKTPRTRLGRGVRLLGSHNIGVCVTHVFFDLFVVFVFYLLELDKILDPEVIGISPGANLAQNEFV